MDSERFDGFVRIFGQTRSRRQTLRGLAGLAAVGALALGGQEADAGKRSGGAPCTKGRQCKTGKCVGTSGAKTCSCSNKFPKCATAGAICQSGACCLPDTADLHAAIAAADAGATLALCAGTWKVDLTGTLDLTKDLTLVGAGAGVTTLDGNDAVQVLRVGSGATVTLRDLTVRKGYGDLGGAIVNQGTLTLRGVGVTDSLGTTGGGIFNHQFSTVVLQTGSRLTGNRSLGDESGSAIFNGNGTVTIDAGVVVCSNTPLDSQCEGGFSGAGACPAPSETCPSE